MPITDKATVMLVPVPVQIAPGPPTTKLIAGKALTVTEWVADVAEHVVVLPSVTVYEMFVDPADTSVTAPELSTVAMEVLDEAHV
jgi:hypothetical protein